MSVVGSRVNVVASTPATVIYRTGARSVHITVKNLGSAEVDLGGSGVTSGSGYQVGAGAVVGPFVLNGGDVLYGISSSGTQSVQVLATNA